MCSFRAKAHTVYFKNRYIVYNENKTNKKGVQKNELI